jgi:hypothetical protein
VRAADVVITMGCGDACPIYPASVTTTGSSRIRLGSLATVRRIRDEIDVRVTRLVAELK